MSFERTRRLLARLLGAGSSPKPGAPGVEATLDGRSAVALVEAMISEGAGLGGPAGEDPTTRALFEARARPVEGAAKPSLRTSHLDPGDGPEGALATAVGMALSGLRSVAFVPGRSLPALVDQLSAAADQQLPLVVHAACTAAEGPTRSLGDGHFGYHAISDTGVLQLFAKNAQEAVDFALIGRRVAELALTPVLVAIDARGTGDREQTVYLPTAGAVRSFLGAPDGFVDAPTRAQAMLFGPRRRRMPRWHDPDRPLLIGAAQDERHWPVTQAGRDPYLLAGREDLLRRSFEAFEVLTGRRYDLLSTPERRRHDLALVAQGSLLELAEQVAEDLQARTKQKVGVIGLRVARPWPGPRLVEAIAQASRVLVLERVARGAPLADQLRQARDRAVENGVERAEVNPGYPRWSIDQRPALFVARIGAGAPARAEDLAAHAQAVLEGAAPRDVTLGVSAAPDVSGWPKRQALVDQLRAVEPAPVVARAPAEDREDAASSGRAAPSAVRAVNRLDTTVSGLARFWDQVGALHAAGADDALSPDPFLATGTMPALTASFSDASRIRETFPRFSPDKCTGCAICWSTCPDGAIGVVAHPPQALLEAGMQQAKAAGQAVDLLRPLLSKIGKAAARAAKDVEVKDPAAVLRPAFEAVLAKSKGDEERQASLRAAFEAALAPIDGLPVSATGPLMFGPEKKKPGAGALLALAIDPDTCKGCGLCVAACPDAALAAEPEQAGYTAAMRARFEAWSRLPDTPGAVIDGVRGDEALGPLGSSLLSRHSRGLVGCDDVEPGSGERQALRLVLGELEAERQRVHAHRLSRLERLGEDVSDRLRSLLDRALPVGDLDALSSGLEQLGREDVDLAALTGQMRDAVDGQRVDAVLLHELTEAGRQLKREAFALREGPQGIGRSRVSMVLAAGSFAEGLARFPHNPFTGPVTVAAPGHTARVARGVFEGHFAALAAELEPERRAELLADKARMPADLELPELTFESLDPEQRRLLTPVVVVGDEASLGEAELGAVMSLLSSERPFKLVVLADPGRRLGPDGGALPTNLGLLAALVRTAYVAQTAVAYPKHFGRAIENAIAFEGPALLHVYAPSPGRDQIAADGSLELARLAVKSRTFPLFTYDPRREGVFGARFSLEGNPSPDAAWVEEALGPLTPEAWLRAQGRFERALDAGVPPRMRAAVERWGAEWRALQELAGEVTPFTARVEAEAEARLQAEHAAALAALEAQHAAALAAQKARFTAETATRVTDRLLGLAGYPTGPGTGARKS